MAEIGNLNVRITGDNADLNQALNESSKGVNSFAKTTATALGSLGASFAVFGALVKGIDFNKAAESAKVAFTVMTGSAKTAEKTLKELKDFANKTPLEFKDIRDATQTLLQFGISAEDATDTIKMLGDVSAGDGQKLQQLALVFGQISSTGKLMGQDLLQLINVGFNPLQEIAKTTGRSMTDLKKDMEKGLITFDMVKESFRTATGENGLFNNMLAKQADTLNGKLSTMNDALETAAGSATESLMPALKGLADITTALANGFATLPAGVQAFTATFVGLGAAVLAAIPILTTFGVTLSASFGPIGFITAGVVALGVALGSAFNDYTVKTIEKYAQKFADIAAVTGVTEENLETFAKQSQKVQATLGQLFTKNFTKEKIEEIAKSFGLTTDQVARIGLKAENVSPKLKQLLETMVDRSLDAVYANKRLEEAMKGRYSKEIELSKKTNDEANAAAALKKAQDEEEKKRREEILAKKREEIKLLNETSLEALNRQKAEYLGAANTAQLKKEVEEWYAAEKKKIDDKAAEERKKADDEALAELNKAMDEEIAIFDAVTDATGKSSKEKVKTWEDSLNEMSDATAEWYKENQKYVDAVFSGFSNMLGSLKELWSADAEFRMGLVDEETQARIEAAGVAEETESERLKREIDEAITAGDTKTEAEKRAELKRIEITKDGERKKAQIKYEADLNSWMANKLLAIASAAQAIITGFAQLGPIGGAIAAIPTGIATGIQIAAIEMAKPQPPKLWTGTTNPIASTAPYIVGDQGVEMVLPKGAEVLNNRDTMGMLGGGGSQSMVVQLYLDGAKVSENVVNYINNGLVRLEMA